MLCVKSPSPSEISLKIAVTLDMGLKIIKFMPIAFARITITKSNAPIARLIVV